MADTTMSVEPANDKSKFLPHDEDDGRDFKATQNLKQRSTGTILLALVASLAIIGASCYVAFSAAQPFPKIEEVIDIECSAVLKSNQRLGQLGFRNFTRPSDDCQAEILRYFRTRATKIPPPEAIRKEVVVKNQPLENTLFATFGLTLVIDVACTWGRLGGRFAVLDWMHKWMTLLCPFLNLAVASASLYSNDYDIPSSRLPAALLIGLSGRVLRQVLSQRYPNRSNYFGTAYVAAGVYMLTQSPVAGAAEMDFAFALTMLFGGRVANKLIDSVGPAGSEQPEADQEKAALAS